MTATAIVTMVTGSIRIQGYSSGVVDAHEDGNTPHHVRPVHAEGLPVSSDDSVQERVEQAEHRYRRQYSSITYNQTQLRDYKQ